MARKHITTSVPHAGKILFDLGKWGSYEAAKRGEIEVIEVGRKKRVPVVWMEKTGGVGPGDFDEILNAIEARKTEPGAA